MTGGKVGSRSLDPQPFRVGEDWYVSALLPDGRIYPIDGFKTERAAKEWIAGRSKLWFREKGSDGDGIHPLQAPYLDVAEILARPVSVAPPPKIKPSTPKIE